MKLGHASNHYRKQPMPFHRHPFKLPSGETVTPHDVIDIKNQLGMDYSLGSFDKVENLGCADGRS